MDIRSKLLVMAGLETAGPGDLTWAKLLATSLSSYVNLAKAETVRVPGLFKKGMKYQAPKASRLRTAVRGMSGVVVKGSGLDQLFSLSTGETMVIFQKQRRNGSGLIAEDSGYLVVFDDEDDAKAWMDSED